MALPSPDYTHARTGSGVASPPQRMRSRTQSISSDRPSTQAYSLMSPPLTVSPEAGFIAASAASQIVTNDHDTHAEAWFDQHGIEPSGETASVSPMALQLVNNFLDQLLLNFLSVARSTKLSALRPAVSEVLKPKLAKDAMNQADEELDEYLGGNADEDYATSQTPIAPRDWDLELVWKRTRLRCMVYSSLGDMEEEDEDFYMEQEHLDAGMEDRLSDIVSPAVAIFLTSILEFMGEQALIVAGQAAFHRLRTRYQKELREGGRDPAHTAERIVVEELDMERVALDRTLGRLWRTWKKKIRTPTINIDSGFGRPGSSSSNRTGSYHSRKTSLGIDNSIPPPLPEPVAEAHETRALQSGAGPEMEEYLRAAALPIPESARDIDEIEVPGLVHYSDDEEEDEDTGVQREDKYGSRPKSLMILPLAATADLPTPVLSEPRTPSLSRKRANSLPTPGATPFSSPAKRAQGEADGSVEAAEASDSATDVTSSSSEATSATASQRASMDRADSAQGPHGHVSVASHAIGNPARPISAVAAEQSYDESGNEAEEVDDFIEEEPQILTSARVSMHGRISPIKPDAQRPNLSNVVPVRTASVHSVRMVDVHTPRSPVTRSRGSSLEASDRSSGSRSGQSRPSSLHAAPVLEAAASAADSNSAHRALAPAATLKSTTGVNGSISEAEESAEETHDEVSPLTPSNDVVLPKPLDPGTVAGLGWMGKEAGKQTSIFGSAPDRAASPTKTPPRSMTKVTILSQPAQGESVLHDDEAEPPRKYSPPAPTLTYAERSASRQPAKSANAPHAAAATSSFGLVSVDRHTHELPPVPESPEQRQGGPRQLHTSGSSNSSGTRHKVMRTSEEHAPVRAGDVARNFEELIQSDQTIQYTLTPENMRAIETSSRPQQSNNAIISVRSRKSEDARHDAGLTRTGSDNPVPGLTRTQSTSRTNGLSSQHVTDGPVVVKPPGYDTRPNGTKRPSAQPRDARPMRESMSDFANFIRTTGPLGGQSDGAPSRAPAGTVVRNISGPVPVSKASLDGGRASTNSNKARLQARDAAVDYHDDNSDLIDFIRRGPPTQAGSGNHRIPRTVAPFRTTMDSDQMSGAVGGRAVDAMVGDIHSGQNSNTAEDQSIQSSVTSQTALLRKNKPSPTSNGTSMFDDEGPMIPQRKQRRVRDPYAIDVSDEEDWDDSAEQNRMAAPPKRAPTQEESLIDFLKNVPPPPEPTVEPFHIQQAQARPKKKSSAPNLISRLSGAARRESNSSISKNAEARSLTSRAGSVKGRGYTPIQVPGLAMSGEGSAPPQQQRSLSSTQIQTSANRGPTGRVLQKKYEPREAVGGSQPATSDLAEFLRSSGPPSVQLGGSVPMGFDGPPVSNSRGYNESTGFARLLTRRKKSAVA